MSTPLAETISKLLQDNWALSSPAVGDILWTDTKPDTIAMPQWTKNYLIGIYNPQNPVSARALCRELWEITENVFIDIYLKVTTTPEAADRIREAIRQECYRISHTQQFQAAGQKTIEITREPYKVESSEAARLVLQVAAVSWDIRQ